MAQQYEYGFLPEDEKYLGLLGNIFSPVRREVLEAPTTEYVDAIDAPMGTQIPVTTEGVYGDPEFGLQYMPAYQAVSGLLGLEADQIVDAAKAAPEALRQMANQQVMSGVDMATGGTGVLVDDEGNEFGYDSLLVAAPLAPAGIAARSAGGATLGALGGKPVAMTPFNVTNELRGTTHQTAYLPDGSRVLLDEKGQPFIEDKTINKLLTGLGIEEMSSVRLDPAEGLLADKKAITPEEIEGEWVLQAAGDRTGYGDLVEVNNQPLYGATRQRGGDDFMRENQGSWSSATTAISSMENQVELLRQGKRSRQIKDPVTGKLKTIIEDIPENQRYNFDAPINLVTSNMAERSGDFSLDTAETIARMIPESKILKKDQKAFDDKIKERFPDYPSSKDPDKLIAWLQKDAQKAGAGARRQVFVDVVSQSPAQKAGFPDIGSVRAAISLPETRFMPSGRTFGAVSLLAPEGELAKVTRLADLENPHPTYPDVIGEAGSYRGGYPVTLSRAESFPDLYQEKIAEGKDPAGIRRAIDIGRVAQFMHPRLVDTQMKQIEDEVRLLKEFGLLND